MNTTKVTLTSVKKILFIFSFSEGLKVKKFPLRAAFTLCIAFLGLQNLHAQMNIDGETLYGHEWINPSQTYREIPVEEDGLYRLDFNTLRDAGIPEASIVGSDLVLYHQGQKVPVYVSEVGLFSEDDFLLFEGKKNRSFLDQFLFAGGKNHLLNPLYSLISDVSKYYLTVGEGESLPLQELENDLSNPDLVPKSYHMQSDSSMNVEELVKPYSKLQGLNTYQSHYVNGEGFSSRIRRAQNLDFEPDNYLDNGLDASLELHVMSDYKTLDEEQELRVRLNNQQVQLYEVEESFQRFHLQVVPDPARLNAPRLRVNFRGMVNGTDRYSIAYGILNYPRAVMAKNNRFEDLPTANRYYEIPGFASEDEAILIAGDKCMFTRWESGVQRVNLHPEINESFKIYDNSIIRDIVPSSIRTYNLDPLHRLQDADLLMISSEHILSTAPSVMEYVEYRESAEGGAYNVALYTSEEINRMFSYGVENHPMGIKNMLAYAKENFDLEHVFFIGKGLQYNLIRTEKQMQLDGREEFEVPTMGYPGNDFLFSSPTNRFEPYFSMGRIAYNKESEIRRFLEKVKREESREYTGLVSEEYWRSQIMHLNGGGQDAHVHIGYELENMEEIAVNSPLPPRIYNFVKSSSSPVQFTDLEEIFETLKRGSNLFTFFGHASTSALSIDLDRADGFENEKLPMMIALGCSSGNLNILGESVGEVYCNYEQGGFIGVIANIHFGLVSDLGVVGNEYYKEFFNNKDDLTAGQALRNALRNVAAIHPNYRRASEQTSYMGDPCLKLQFPQGKDPALSTEHISVNPIRATVESDSLELSFSIFNLGILPEDSLHVQVQHLKPTGDTVSLLEKKIWFVEGEREIKLHLKPDSSFAGNNRILIRVNGDQNIVESPDQALINNSLQSLGLAEGYEFYVANNEVDIIYPTEFSIVPDEEVSLLVNGSGYIDTSSVVLFEIDTTEYFNSPFRRSGQKDFIAGISSWTPPITLVEEQVYYWRAAYKNKNSGEPRWHGSSFVYLPEKTGWNQSHYFQLRKNGFENLQYDSTRQLITRNDYRLIQIKNSLDNNNDGMRYTNNGQSFNQSSYWLNNFTGAYVVVHNAHNFWYRKFSPPGGMYGSYNPTNSTKRAFAFPLDSAASRIDLVNFIEDIVDEDERVALLFHQAVSTDSFHVEDWVADSTLNGGKNIFNVLEKYGATKVRDLLQNIDAPYGIFFSKNGQLFDEKIAEDENGVIKISANLEQLASEGKVFSPSVSEISQYQNLHYRLKNYPDEDSSKVILYSSEGDTLATDSLKIENNLDISDLDVEEFPACHLEWQLWDEEYFTVPQIDFWRLYYRPLPDFAIAAKNEFANTPDSVERFNAIDLDFSIYNISDQEKEALEYSIKLYDHKNELVLDSMFVYESVIPAYVQADIHKNLALEAEADFLDLYIEVNPARIPVESRYDNNVIFKRIQILKDLYDPELTVYFDRERISNGDIVSPETTIDIYLRDPKELKAFADTSLIEFRLYDPEENFLSAYTYNSPAVQFYPSNAAGEAARVSIAGNFTVNGLYTLTVNGGDNSMNSAGKYDYRVQFYVIREHGITQVYNAPNPFSEETFFHYTLTGSHIPKEYKITIADQSGRIVRILDQSEIGPLKVGKHKSFYPWDGRSDVGTLLPNGLYFYRFELGTQDAEELKHISSPRDAYFPKSWGKLILLRE